MTSVRLEPIFPKRPIANGNIAAREAESKLKTWGGNVMRKMQSYPAQQPTPYRRTGSLGRGWQMRASKPAGNLTVEVSNGVAYAGYVEGFSEGPAGVRQTRVMAGKGWSRLDEVAKREFDSTVKGINWSGK